MKFFVQLRHSIDQDETFQLVLNKIQTLIDNVEILTFKEALNNIIEKEKSRIIQAFANAKECETNDDDGDDDVWCSMINEAENDNVGILEAFKIYVLYYQGIKKEKIRMVAENPMSHFASEICISTQQVNHIFWDS